MPRILRSGQERGLKCISLLNHTIREILYNWEHPEFFIFIVQSLSLLIHTASPSPLTVSDLLPSRSPLSLLLDSTFGRKLPLAMEDTPTGRKASSATVTQGVVHSRNRKPIDDHAVTGAGQITTRQSILPVCLVTVLFFMWGFAYGLLDVFNALSECIEYQPGNVGWPSSSIFWGILHWTIDVLGLDCPSFWI